MGTGTSPVPRLLSIAFGGLDAPVIVPDDPALVAALQACVKGWAFSTTPLDLAAGQPTPPFCVIEPRPNGLFRAHSRFLDGPLDGLTTASALCAILADLSQLHANSCDNHVLGLHCGGVSIGENTLILAGERRAGKSTLVARLACEDGVTLFSDDVLPISAAGTITALGLAPRLRLPLPDRASNRFRRHVHLHLGPADDRYGYLVTPNLAPHGHAARAGAFILLDRRPEGPASLHDLPKDELLQALVARSISGPEGPEAVFDAAENLASTLTGLRLVYSDLEEAVALLHAAFPRDQAVLGPNIRTEPPLRQGDRPDPPPCQPIDPTVLLRRCKDTAVRHVEAAAFLWRPGDATLWHMNPTALAVWTLLEAPARANDVASALGRAFPDQDKRRVLDDTRLILSQLAEEGFVSPVR